jgi:hypothetical protein
MPFWRGETQARNHSILNPSAPQKPAARLPRWEFFDVSRTGVERVREFGCSPLRAHRTDVASLHLCGHLLQGCSHTRRMQRQSSTGTDGGKTWSNAVEKPVPPAQTGPELKIVRDPVCPVEAGQQSDGPAGGIGAAWFQIVRRRVCRNGPDWAVHNRAQPPGWNHRCRRA